MNSYFHTIWSPHSIWRLLCCLDLAWFCSFCDNEGAAHLLLEDVKKYYMNVNCDY